MKVNTMLMFLTAPLLPAGGAPDREAGDPSVLQPAGGEGRSGGAGRPRRPQQHPQDGRR